MSAPSSPPSARSRGDRWPATLSAQGVILAVNDLSAARVGVTLGLDPADPATETLHGQVARLEHGARRLARRRMEQERHAAGLSLSRGGRRRPRPPGLRAQRTVSRTHPMLRMLGPRAALAPLLSADAPLEAALGRVARAEIRVFPVILPAAGLAALELTVIRLSAAASADVEDADLAASFVLPASPPFIAGDLP